MGLDAPIAWDRAAPVEQWHGSDNDYAAAVRLHWRAETRRRLERGISLNESGSLALEVDYEKCKRSCLYFLNQYCCISDPEVEPAYRVMPIVLWDSQVDIVNWWLERWAAKEIACVPKTRKLGITWLALWIVQWRWLFEPGFTCLIGSRKVEMVDRRGDMGSLFEKLRFITGSLPRHIKPIIEEGDGDKCRLLKNKDMKTEIAGEHTTRNFGGGRRHTLVLIDEFSRIDPVIAEQTWLSLETVAEEFLIIWNPGPTAHKSYDLAHGRDSKLDDRLLYFMDWKADPRRPPDFEARKTIAGGLGGRLTKEEFAVSHLGKYGVVLSGRVFPVDVDNLIYTDELPPIDCDPVKLRTYAEVMGGMDFGSGPSILAWAVGMLDLTQGYDKAKILIDDERAWKSVEASTAAADMLAVQSQYRDGDEIVTWGDPTGKARGPDQEHWESHFQGGGAMVICLPFDESKVNSTEWRESRIKDLIWTWINPGRLFINKRCEYLIECLRSWGRSLPDGARVDWLDRAFVRPKHDLYSHGGMALLYLMEAVERWIAARGGEEERAMIEILTPKEVVGVDALFAGDYEEGIDLETSSEMLPWP